MNKSETKAKKWLVEKKGYEESDIVFQPIGTPDFLCSDGRSYEVKRIYQNTVWFYSTQIEQIQAQQKSQVLVMADNCDEPIVILEPEQLKDGAIIAGARIKIKRIGRLSIYLDEERYRFLLGRGKASTIAKGLLEKKIDEEKEDMEAKA